MTGFERFILVRSSDFLTSPFLIRNRVPYVLLRGFDSFSRADQGNYIKANEYMDSPEVLDAKLDLVAALIAASESMIVYTGAGLSKSSGIPDYATKAEQSVVKVPTPLSFSVLDFVCGICVWLRRHLFPCHLKLLK